MNRAMIFGAYIRGHYFNAVAKSEGEARAVIWRQALSSWSDLDMDSISPFRAWSR